MRHVAPGFEGKNPAAGQRAAKEPALKLAHRPRAAVGDLRRLIEPANRAPVSRAVEPINLGQRQAAGVEHPVMHQHPHDFEFAAQPTQVLPVMVAAIPVHPPRLPRPHTEAAFVNGERVSLRVFQRPHLAAIRPAGSVETEYMRLIVARREKLAVIHAQGEHAPAGRGQRGPTPPALETEKPRRRIKRRGVKLPAINHQPAHRLAAGQRAAVLPGLAAPVAKDFPPGVGIRGFRQRRAGQAIPRDPGVERALELRQRGDGIARGRGAAIHPVRAPAKPIHAPGPPRGRFAGGGIEFAVMRGQSENQDGLARPPVVGPVRLQPPVINAKVNRARVRLARSHARIQRNAEIESAPGRRVKPAHNVPKHVVLLRFRRQAHPGGEGEVAGSQPQRRRRRHLQPALPPVELRRLPVLRCGKAHRVRDSVVAVPGSITAVLR